MSAESIDLQSITSLFDIQLSDRSGLVRAVQTAEELLCQYELLTTTNFACIKQSQGFGSTGKVFQTVFKPPGGRGKGREWVSGGGGGEQGIGVGVGGIIFFNSFYY